MNMGAVYGYTLALLLVAAILTPILNLVGAMDISWWWAFTPLAAAILFFFLAPLQPNPANEEDLEFYRHLAGNLFGIGDRSGDLVWNELSEEYGPPYAPPDPTGEFTDYDRVKILLEGTIEVTTPAKLRKEIRRRYDQIIRRSGDQRIQE